MFIPNKNFERELTAEGKFKGSLADAAQAVVDNAKSFAPVRTGAYRDGLKVVQQGGKVYASGTDWKSGFIEFGTADTPIFAPLRRGTRAAGLTLKESSSK